MTSTETRYQVWTTSVLFGTRSEELYGETSNWTDAKSKVNEAASRVGVIKAEIVNLTTGDVDLTVHDYTDDEPLRIDPKLAALGTA